MTNLRQALYQCMENSVEVDETTKCIKLFSVDTSSPYTIELYIDFIKNNKADKCYIDLTISSGSSVDGKPLYQIKKISIPNLGSISVNEDKDVSYTGDVYSLEYDTDTKNNSATFYFKYIGSNEETFNSFNIKKELKYGTYVELLSEVADNNSSNSICNFLNNTNLSGNGHLVEIGDTGNVYVDTLTPIDINKSKIGSSEKKFKNAYIDNITSTSIKATTGEIETISTDTISVKSSSSSSIGSSNNKFKNAFIDNITSTNILTDNIGSVSNNVEKIYTNNFKSNHIEDVNESLTLSNKIIIKDISNGILQYKSNGISTFDIDCDNNFIERTNDDNGNIKFSHKPIDTSRSNTEVAATFNDSTDNKKQMEFGKSLYIPSFNYDKCGHIISNATAEFRLPDISNEYTNNTSSTAFSTAGAKDLYDTLSTKITELDTKLTNSNSTLNNSITSLDSKFSKNPIINNSITIKDTTNSNYKMTITNNSINSTNTQSGLKIGNTTSLINIGQPKNENSEIDIYANTIKAHNEKWKIDLNGDAVFNTISTGEVDTAMLNGVYPNKSWLFYIYSCYTQTNTVIGSNLSVINVKSYITSDEPYNQLNGSEITILNTENQTINTGSVYSIRIYTENFGEKYYELKYVNLSLVKFIPPYATIKGVVCGSSIIVTEMHGYYYTYRYDLNYTSVDLYKTVNTSTTYNNGNISEDLTNIGIGPSNATNVRVYANYIAYDTKSVLSGVSASYSNGTVTFYWHGHADADKIKGINYHITANILPY